MLTNPQRRIEAEVHWFLDCSADEIKEIDSWIYDKSSDIEDSFYWSGYSALTQLNIQLARIDSPDYSNTSEAKFYILRISRLFESIEIADVLRIINENRRQAGFYPPGCRET